MQEIIDIGFRKMNELGANKTPFMAFINFDLSKIHVVQMHELNAQEICVSFPTFCNKATRKITANAIQKKPLAIANYQKGFNMVMQNIMHGNSFLCNYTCSTPIEYAGDVAEIFDSAVAKYKIKYKQEWVCFSPETFIQIKDNTIHTYPMKGTIDADLPDAEKLILEDKKETAEHYTIVDLLRNDLSIIAYNVQVKKFRYIDKIKTARKNLLQVSSHITGDLPNEWNEKIGTMLHKILPAGSISGAPKNKTLAIIQEAEMHNRDFYTGIAVYYDGKELDSCVLIRFIEQTANGLVYKSGGGITYQSIAMQEYMELNDKIYIPTA
jgi:para-aminobenzoate synthetase component I